MSAALQEKFQKEEFLQTPEEIEQLEETFGLQVVGNYFKDLKGLLSIAPLGLRMVTKSKFPLSFEPSQGAKQVRSLMEAVKREKQLTVLAERFPEDIQ